jgi:hypothetical protein
MDTVADRDDAVRLLEAAYKDTQKRVLTERGQQVVVNDLKTMNRFSRQVYLKKFFPQFINQKEKEENWR